MSKSDQVDSKLLHKIQQEFSKHRQRTGKRANYPSRLKKLALLGAHGGSRIDHVARASKPLASSLWQQVVYSSENTAQQLMTRLNQLSEMIQIKKNFDIDTVSDLLSYQDIRFDELDLLPEQMDLIRWARSDVLSNHAQVKEKVGKSCI